jgi:hypothetical protein
MVLMMNKNFPAFLTFVLRDQHFPIAALEGLVDRCCCKIMATEIQECTWDQEKAILMTPRDRAKKSMDELTMASWYKDPIVELGIGDKGKKGLPPPPENLYKLDEEQSVFMIHHKNDPILEDGNSTHLREQGEAVNLAASDEDSDSPSCTVVEPHLPAATGEDNIKDESSASSEEVSGGANSAAGAG